MKANEEGYRRLILAAKQRQAMRNYRRKLNLVHGRIRFHKGHEVNRPTSNS